ncbi:MAG: CDP-glycerol glycerophosphotransferase family protein, partial [Patescibacteria group bacterium]
NFFRYFGGLFANRLLAWPVVRKIVRWLDFILIHQDCYAPVFEKYQPDLVFLAHLFDEPEIALLREAKKRGVKTVGLINSWDKTTARCILRLLPDKAIVFNEIVKRELMAHDEMKAENIFISGLPQYDIYWQAQPHSREEFFNAIGIGSEKKLIIYAPNGRYSKSADGLMIDTLHTFVENAFPRKDVGLLVRFQPNDFVDLAEIQKRPWLVYEIPGLRFSSKRGVDWDMDADDIKLLTNTLFHSSLFICYTSSLSIDAAVFDKPIINIDFELEKSDNPLNSPTMYYNMDHYINATKTGGIRVVKSREELFKWISLYLANPALDAVGRRRLVLEQCGTVDGRAGERIGQFTLKNLL